MYEDALKGFFDEYEWLHLTLGLIRNTLFLSGSVLFLLNSESIGIPAFIVGSFLMIIDSLGSILVKHAQGEL